MRLSDDFDEFFNNMMNEKYDSLFEEEQHSLIPKTQFNETLKDDLIISSHILAVNIVHSHP